MNPWRLLTTRGRLFLVTGALGCVLVVVFNLRQLAVVAALLAVLPLLALALVARPLGGFRCDRVLPSERVQVGSTLDVLLALQRPAGHRFGEMLCEEAVPPSMGSHPRFTMAGEQPGETVAVDYQLPARQRGHFQIGPLRVRRVDPFGLAARDHLLDRTDPITVTPQLFELVSTPAGASGYSPEVSNRNSRLLGADDLLVRDYERGDDVRRISWKSSAHRGRLMVRQQEPTDEPDALLFLDSRSCAHAGHWQHSSFEWAVSAVTSIALHLLDQGFRLRIEDANGPIDLLPQVDREAMAWQAVELLTDEVTTDTPALPTPGRSRDEVGNDDLLIAIIGTLGGGDLLALSRARGTRGTGIAVLLDAPTFADPGQHDPGVAAMAAALTADQWRVVVVEAADSLPAVWESLRALAGARR